MGVCLAGIIFLFCKVFEVFNLLFAGVILRLCPVVKGLDFLLSCIVLRVKLSIKLGDVCDSGLVILLLSLLKRFDFILSEVIFSLCCVDKSIMVLSESINFTLALVVGLEKSLECVPQLCVETGASIECGGKVSFHCVCLICLLVYIL